MVSAFMSRIRFVSLYSMNSMEPKGNVSYSFVESFNGSAKTTREDLSQAKIKRFSS